MHSRASPGDTCVDYDRGKIAECQHTPIAVLGKPNRSRYLSLRFGRRERQRMAACNNCAFCDVAKPTSIAIRIF
jgi:hypothetical protein